MGLFFLLVALGVVALAAALLKHDRRRRLSELQAEWATPHTRAHKMDAILASHRSRVAASGASSLDDRTWNDLNLGAVFESIDRTASTLGQHALYHRLRTTPIADHLDAFEALITRMGTDAPARERAQLGLGRLKDAHGYDLWWMGQPGAIEVRWWYFVFPILSAITFVALALVPFWPRALGVLIAVLVANAVARTSADTQLRTVIGAFRQLAPLITAGQSLTFLRGDDIEPIVGPLAPDVPRLGRLKTVARWVSQDPLMLTSESLWLATPLTDIANVVYDYLNLVLLLDANAAYFGARDLQLHRASLLRVIAAMGDVDAAISVASFRAETDGWVSPIFIAPGTAAVLTDIRHPLVQAAVPNSIELSPARGVLLTGSNMSGKSTFLRTVGVSTVMAQTIHTCLATKYEAPVFRVRSCIGRADDLLAGKSYYIVEVEALLELVRDSRSPAPHLFLLDELFRGTNAVERIAAAEAVLAELLIEETLSKPHVVLAATHDGELVELLRGIYTTNHFSDTIGPGGLVFEYRLQPGPATTRNAISLLELQGAPATLVSRALRRAAALDRDRATGARVGGSA